MRLRVLLLLFFTFIYALSAVAGEQVLCVVSSDLDSDTGKIVVEMDQDNRTILHLYMDSYHDTKLTTRTELKASDLQAGIVLNRKDKYIIVRMHSDNFEPESGGLLYLDTLYNAISGERKEYLFDLAMELSGPVLIQNKQNFKAMKFVAKRSKVLGVIGIEKVVFEN